MKSESEILKKPSWLKTRIPAGTTYSSIKRQVQKKCLGTVCEESRCPNIETCWNQNTATFMILGKGCTRSCRFCNVKSIDPKGSIDPKEAENLAQTIQNMNLDYAVITMVTRDDLFDGGAEHFVNVIKAIRKQTPHIKIEGLVSDFGGNSDSISTILEESPVVFAHNLETVEKLSPKVRDPKANYKTSLQVLKTAKKLSNYPLITKSSLMVGLGETKEELISSLYDLIESDVDFVTIGQYLQPSRKHLPVTRYWLPQEFDELKFFAKKIGFKSVASGPLVRSSYKAREFYLEATK